MFWNWPWLRTIATPVKGGGCVFDWPVVVAGALAGFLLLAWFGRLPCPKSAEESLEETIERGQHEVLPPLGDELHRASGVVA
jgi:hypothetical protein